MLLKLISLKHLSDVFKVEVMKIKPLASVKEEARAEGGSGVWETHSGETEKREGPDAGGFFLIRETDID